MKIPHTPGPCPVPPDTIVIATLENGDTLMPMRADEIDWYCPGDDVIEYEIVEQ